MSEGDLPSEIRGALGHVREGGKALAGVVAGASGELGWGSGSGGA